MITKNASPRGLHFFFLLRALRARGVKERKSPARGGFTPSKRSTGLFSVRKLYCEAVIKLSISTKLRVILSGATAESKDLAQRPAR